MSERATAPRNRPSPLKNCCVQYPRVFLCAENAIVPVQATNRHSWIKPNRASLRRNCARAGLFAGGGELASSQRLGRVLVGTNSRGVWDDC